LQAGASKKKVRLVGIKDSKSAAWNKWVHITTGKPQIRIR
jgi:hypothetical protein